MKQWIIRQGCFKRLVGSIVGRKCGHSNQRKFLILFWYNNLFIFLLNTLKFLIQPLVYTLTVYIYYPLPMKLFHFSPTVFSTLFYIIIHFYIYIINFLQFRLSVFSCLFSSKRLLPCLLARFLLFRHFIQCPFSWLYYFPTLRDYVVIHYCALLYVIYVHCIFLFTIAFISLISFPKSSKRFVLLMFFPWSIPIKSPDHFFSCLTPQELHVRFLHCKGNSSVFDGHLNQVIWAVRPALRSY